jgi:endonuclease/exonuclease/phosphatase family metal-dependent hydrolase
VAELTVLTWNIYHGRDRPPSDKLRTLRSLLLRRDEYVVTHVHVNRRLRDEFAALIARTEWDVCLLQEAPPSWDAALARATGAATYVTLTSRNSLGFLRRAIATWNPNLMGSWEGGSNITLVRPTWRIGITRAMLLNPFPRRRLRERRRMSFVRLHGAEGDICVANVHLSTGSGPPQREARLAAATAVEWAGNDPLVLGGDFNMRPRYNAQVFGELEGSFGLTGRTAPDAIDHLLARGLETVRAPTAWPDEMRELQMPIGLETRRLRLSDHAPVEATFALR